MIYVVGTGRCGTKSIANLLNGVHEPKPRIVVEANDYFNGDRHSFAVLAQKLRKRAMLPTTLISDNKQSLVIPLLAKIDPSAHFVVLFREPIASIASFIGRHWYRRPSIWETNRLRPWNGFPMNWSQTMKCAWLWRETYRRIISTVQDESVEFIETRELGPHVLNANANTKQLRPNRSEREFIERHLAPMYEQMLDLRSVAPNGPIRQQLPELVE